MQLVVARLRRHLDGARCGAPVLRAVVRGQDLHFLNRIQAGIHHQRAGSAIQSGVEHVAAIDFKRVVFDAAAVDAVLHAADHAHFGFVLAGLIADARGQRDQLSKVAAVKSDRYDFFLRDGAGNLEVSVSTFPRPFDSTLTSVFCRPVPVRNQALTQVPQ